MRKVAGHEQMMMLLQVKATMDNVAGVKIPKFEQIVEGADTRMALTGLSKGGKSIQVRTMVIIHHSISTHMHRVVLRQCSALSPIGGHCHVPAHFESCLCMQWRSFDICISGSVLRTILKVYWPGGMTKHGQGAEI